MLDVQELEPRSGETCLVRQLERSGFSQIGQANAKLVDQNARVLEVANGLLATFGESESNLARPGSRARLSRLLRVLRRSK